MVTDTVVQSRPSPRGSGKDDSSTISTTTTVTPASLLLDHVLLTPLSLWNPDEMLLVAGPMIILTQPFGALSLAQRDIFMQTLCSSLFGMTLLDLGHHLNASNFSSPSQQILTPFPFLEKVIMRLIELGNPNRIEVPLTGLLYNPCSSEDERLASHFQNIIPEIENLLGLKKDCDLLLRNFYQTIFPLYPFMDVCIFEDELETLLIEDETNMYKLNVSGRDVRKKIETVSLLLIILAMSLRQSILDSNLLTAIRRTASKRAQQISLTSHRLLCLLDVFRSPNETTFTCLLYFTFSEYLNQDDTDTVLTPTRLLTIKQITDLTITLGLHHDPSKFNRLKNPQIIRRRRMLWLGVQSLRYQLSIPEGEWDYTNNWNMKNFSAAMDASNGWNDTSTDYMGNFRNGIQGIFQDKVEFHMLLAKMVSNCIPLEEHACLSRILDSIGRVEEFMSQVFPVDALRLPQKHHTLNFIRNSLLDIDAIKNTEIFLANIIGGTCVLNVWDTLSVCFEKKCKMNWEENEAAYHYFTLKAFEEYLKLAGIICDYLDDRIGGKILKEYSYAIDKQVCFALVRVCLFHIRILLRLCFKADSRKTSTTPGQQEDALVQMLTSYMRNQLVHITNLACKRLEECYLCTFQAVPILRYIVHAIDSGSLVSVTKIFWEKTTIDGEIPKHVEQKVSLKWGLNRGNWVSIERQLTSARTLQSFNEVLLKRLENAIYSNSFGKSSITVVTQDMSSEYINSTGNDALNQFMQNNADILWDILFDNDVGEDRPSQSFGQGP